MASLLDLLVERCFFWQKDGFVGRNMALLVFNVVRPQIQLLYTIVVKPEYRVTCVLQFQAQLLVILSSDQLQRFHRRFLECVDDQRALDYCARMVDGWNVRPFPIRDGFLRKRMASTYYAITKQSPVKQCIGLGWCQLEASDEWDFCLAGGHTGLVLSSRCTPPGFPRLSREDQVKQAK